MPPVCLLKKVLVLISTENELSTQFQEGTSLLGEDGFHFTSM